MERDGILLVVVAKLGKPSLCVGLEVRVGETEWS